VIIAAEMLPGTSQGMGDFLMTANDLFRMDFVLVAIIIIGFVGAILNLFIDWIMKRFIRWEGKL
jgi:NitT/TauT family transport system permease protein